MLALKYIFRDDLGDRFLDIVKLIMNLADKKKGMECLELLLRYLSQGTDKLTKEDFIQVKNVILAGGLTMPTLAEQWFEEGLQKGLLEGLPKKKLKYSAAVDTINLLFI